MKRKLSKLISLLLCVVMVLGIMPITGLAIDATAITITETDGTQTVVTDTTSGTKWSYNKDNNTLTLNGWTGRGIVSKSTFNLHLVGENNINMPATASSTTYGIKLDKGYVAISADDGGVLNIKAENFAYNGDAYAVCGGVSAASISSGTVNVNMTTTTHTQNITAFSGSVSMEGASVLNVKIDASGVTDKSSSLIGIIDMSGYGLSPADQATVNIDIKGGNKHIITGCSMRTLASGIIEANKTKTTIKVSGGAEATKKPMAIIKLSRLSFAEGGFLDFSGGYVSFDTYNLMGTNVNTVSTIPANDEYICSPEHEFNGQKALYMQGTDGSYLTAGRFEYAPTSTFKIVSDKVEDGVPTFTIPVAKVGEYPTNSSIGWLSFYQYLRGYSNPSNVKFEILNGTLPTGIRLYNGGKVREARILDTPTAPTAAGSVTIKATEGENSTTFKVKWNDIAEADKYITINGTKLEMKTSQDKLSTEKWKYDGATQTLTLDGYTGGTISAEKSFNIHLKGENTINMPTAASSTTYGIKIDNGYVAISADDGGVLNIKAENFAYNGYAYAVYGGEAAASISSGTVNVNMITTTHTQSITAFSGSVSVKGVSVLNVNIDASGVNDQDSYIYGVIGKNNYGLITYDQSVVNVNIKGGNKHMITGCSMRTLASGIIEANKTKTTIKVSGGADAFNKPMAIIKLSRLSFAEGGFLDFSGGYVSFDTYNLMGTNVNTVSTIPANDEYICSPEHEFNGQKALYMQGTDGSYLTAGRFEYAPTSTFKIVSDKVEDGVPTLTIPVANVGENPTNSTIGWLSFYQYLRGYSNPSNVKFEILNGTLPTGIRLYNGGKVREARILDTPTAPTAAGSVTIKATEGENSTTFKVKWNDITSPKPVTALNVSESEIVLEKNSTKTIDITVTPEDATYANVAVSMDKNIIGASVSGPDSTGKSVLTINSYTTAGTVIVTVKSLDTGLEKTITVKIKESVPNIRIDYIGQLVAFDASAKYLINGTEFTPNADGKINIDASWYGTTVEIIKKGETAETNSAPQSLAIPAIPAKPAATVVNASVPEKTDGKLNNVDNTMEYRLKDSDTWFQIYETSIWVGVGEYEIRVRAADGTFRSESQFVTVAADHYHTEEIMPAKAASCAEKGLTEGKKCSECGKVFVEQTEIEMLDHISGGWEVKTPATTEAEGLKVKKCTACGVELESEAIPKLTVDHTHDYSIITVTKKPSCTEEGERKLSCACGESKTEKIAKIAHTPSDWIVKTPATTEAEGLKVKKCTACGLELESEKIPKLTVDHTHDYSIITVTKEPSCTEEGERKLSCACGDSKTEKIAKTEHTVVDVPGKAATCTEKGLTDGKKCSVCGVVTVPQKEIPAKGHTPSDWIVEKAATVDAEGLEIRKCTVCGAKLEERAIPKLTPSYMLGDINGDGKVKANDARTALRAAAKLEELDETAKKAADIDGNGKVSAAEARKILRFAAKLDKELK